MSQLLNSSSPYQEPIISILQLFENAQIIHSDNFQQAIHIAESYLLSH